MNWAEIKDHVSQVCLAGAVVPSWSLAHEVAGLNPFSVMTNIFVTEFAEFSEIFRKNSIAWKTLFEFFLIEFYRIYRISKIFFITKDYSNLLPLVSETRMLPQCQEDTRNRGIFKLTPIHASDMITTAPARHTWETWSLISVQFMFQWFIILWIHWISISFRKNSIDSSKYPSNPWSPKVNWCTNKSGVKDPSINTCQDISDGKAWDCKHKKWATTVLWLRVQSQLEETFLLNLFCFNTILVEWSI